MAHSFRKGHPKAGVFLEFCHEAGKAENANQKYLFMIDEINRGNVSKIFGETILALDREYTVQLPTTLTAKDGTTVTEFRIPENVYILSSLPESAKAMHDHNIVNYNKQFSFQNIECNIHLERDLQKIADDTGHTVLLSIKELIAQTIHERKKLLEKGIGKFEEEYIEKFNTNLSELLEKAEKVARENDSKYSGQPERALVERIKNFRENYFAWVYDFTLPTTNNLSERALRGIKSKMKISGQFSSVETAEFYADIRTYIDTCRRNGINEMEALTRLCNGTPYTVQEIFG